MKQEGYKSKYEIKKVEVTTDVLTGRGGLALFVRYLYMVGIYELLAERFNWIRKSMKGVAVWNIFKQIFCFFYDGTSRHLVYFDDLKKDEGYGGIIENSPKEMISSHQVKRFFRVFPLGISWAFRKALKVLFIWRLKIKKPEVIMLTLDTMPMDNDEAEEREGVSVTYKGYKGFQPLQIIWERKIVDVIFRSGSKHGNHGKIAVNMVSSLVKQIREEYSSDATIILRIDGGFFDKENLKVCDGLDIGIICSGKIYDKTKGYVLGLHKDEWKVYDNGHQEWDYAEFGYRYDSWERFYRGIYTKPRYKGRQELLEFARPENIIITNIGVNHKVLANIGAEKQEEMRCAEWIIKEYHQRGADELPHRGIKEFGFEEMPFERFAANNAFYYCMVIAFFLFETFKEDVLEGVVPVGAYANTVRRKVVDFAGKIVRISGEIILKVSQAVMDGLGLKELWIRSRSCVSITGTG